MLSLLSQSPGQESYDNPREWVEKKRHYQKKSVYSRLQVFPVVTCSCERWTIKKVEHQRTDAFKLSLISYFTLSNEFIPFDFERLYICILNTCKIGIKERGHLCTYGWLMLRFDRKQQNSLKQLSFNKNILQK